ncbi:MAG: helix-turn-helix transcriptional regulator [Saprospiraceae bacterium]|nr:helix-turn-helix transcriptional regulator [Saprospiraceae bacterium]
MIEQQENVIGFTTLNLAGNLRTIRKRMNYSQEDLAKRVGLNRGNIASYENGTAEPKICSLLKIAHIYGVSMVDLVLRDLSEENNYELATTSFKQRNDKDKSVIDHQEKISQELENVMNGLHTCHQFKLKTLEPDAPRELQAFAHKFEELYDVANKILENHKELLSFVACRLKQNKNC